MIKKSGVYYAQTENVIESEGLLWFTDMWSGDLLTYNLQNDKAALIWKCNDAGHRIFGSISKWDNKIIMVPFVYDKIIIYDIKTGSHKNIEIAKSPYNRLIGWGCSASSLSSHIYENSLYITPSLYPGIIEINLVTENMIIYNLPGSNDSNLKQSEEGEVAFFRSSFLFENKIYMPCCRDNSMYIFDLKSKAFIDKKLGNERYRFSAVIKHQGFVWVAPRKGSVVLKWKENEDFVEDIPIKSDEFISARMVIYGGEIRLISVDGKEFYYDSDLQIFSPAESVDKFYALNNSTKEIYSNNMGEIRHIDEKGINHTIKICLPDEELVKILNAESVIEKAVKENRFGIVVLENDSDTIDRFLSYLCG